MTDQTPKQVIADAIHGARPISVEKFSNDYQRKLDEDAARIAHALRAKGHLLGPDEIPVDREDLQTVLEGIYVRPDVSGRYYPVADRLRAALSEPQPVIGRGQFEQPTPDALQRVAELRSGRSKWAWARNYDEALNGSATNPGYWYCSGHLSIDKALQDTWYLEDPEFGLFQLPDPTQEQPKMIPTNPDGLPLL